MTRRGTAAFGANELNSHEEESAPVGEVVAEEHGKLYGVLVTFRRPVHLAETLRLLGEQTKPFDELIVVDNEPNAESELNVRRYEELGLPVHYISSKENIGNAGAYELGMERILSYARDRDWVVLLDDDDPPETPDALRRLNEFADAMLSEDPKVAGVGFIGARFDWKRGSLVRLADDELDGPVRVDYVGNGHFPAYLVRAIRDVGPFAGSIFFGFGELEFGLRLRAAGYSIYADGPLVHKQRTTYNLIGANARPKVFALSEPTWRRYYTLRNLIYILRMHGAVLAAIRVTLVRGFGKPLANLPRTPRSAWRHLKLNWRACRDAWRGRMGRTIHPDIPDSDR